MKLLYEGFLTHYKLFSDQKNQTISFGGTKKERKERNGCGIYCDAEISPTSMNECERAHKLNHSTR